MKVCARCSAEKACDQFSAAPRTADGLAPWCRDCHREYSREWSKANRQRRNAKAAEWRASNPDKARATATAYSRRNVTRRAAEHAQWAKANADKRAATTAKRKAAKLSATPPWADLAAIAQFYAEARRIQRETGVRMHVDHIVPLQHPLVCGLHCERNLRVIPGAMNEAKRNIWSPEDAQRQGDFFVEAAA